MARTRRDPPRPGAARSLGQLLVVTVGGTGIGALLILLAFPDATPVGPPVLLGAAAALAAVTAWASLRLGHPRSARPAPARKKATAARKPAARKPAARKRAGTRKTTARKKPANRKTAHKKAAPRKKQVRKTRAPRKKTAAGKRSGRKPAQGRGRR